jgi:hypothetical protein
LVIYTPSRIFHLFLVWHPKAPCWPSTLDSWYFFSTLITTRPSKKFWWPPHSIFSPSCKAYKIRIVLWFSYASGSGWLFLTTNDIYGNPTSLVQCQTQRYIYGILPFYHVEPPSRTDIPVAVHLEPGSKPFITHSGQISL